MYRGDPSKHRCCAFAVTKRRQCNRTAMSGHYLCDTHGMRHKWYIQVQSRRVPLPHEDRNDRKSWRKISVWPLLFDTYAEARAFADACFTFENCGHKPSMSIERTRKVFPVPTRFRDRFMENNNNKPIARQSVEIRSFKTTRL